MVFTRAVVKAAQPLVPVLALTIILTLVADAAGARGFTLSFKYTAAPVSAVVRPRDLLTTSTVDTAMLPRGTPHLNSDILAMTLIPPDDDVDEDVDRPAGIALSGFLTVPGQSPQAGPVTRASAGIFDLTPRRSPGFGRPVRGLTSPNVAAVPVPPSVALLAVGLAGLVLLRRRRNRQTASA